MKMIDQILASDLKRLSQTYKVLTIFWPRQAGKYTLAKQIFPEYEFTNLEDSALSSEAKEDRKVHYPALNAAEVSSRKA